MINVGSVVTGELVETVINKSMGNESELNDEGIIVCDAFESPLIHFDKSTREYSL